MNDVARDLVRRGYAVWNLEYRRLGAPTGGWPGTFDDVIAGIDHLGRLTAEGIDLDLDRVVVSGHSAGGHLALWAGAQTRRPDRGVRVRAVVGQAPLADLVRAAELDLGCGAVHDLLGGTPAEVPERYRSASPLSLVPLNVPQLLIHGAADDVVPIDVSRRYARDARAAGDAVELVELPGGHMDFLDPASAAHAALCDWLERVPFAE